MDQAEAARLEERINREVTARFPAGSVQRATLVLDADDPALEPDELLVRVFVDAPGPSGADPQQFLDDWARTHEVGMRRRATRAVAAAATGPAARVHRRDPGR